jgi:hypothetical protein
MALLTLIGAAVLSGRERVECMFSNCVWSETVVKTETAVLPTFMCQLAVVEACLAICSQGKGHHHPIIVVVLADRTPSHQWRAVL